MNIFGQPAIFGIVASALSTLSLLPQIIKLIQEKKSGDISLGMFTMLLIGFACWIYYGLLKNDYLIVIANAISFLLNATTLTLSIHYKNKS
jgi:MtN3 and saliva related transmembrane protein